MIYTATGYPLPDVTITLTQANISRAKEPERHWNPVVILSFLDDPATEALLTTPGAVTLLREENTTPEAIITATHYLDGLYQVQRAEGRTYLWFWLTRTERGERIAPAALETLSSQVTLQGAQIQAQSDRSDFVEDCIAEMAVQVYQQ